LDDCLKLHIKHISKKFKDFKKYGSGKARVGGDNAVRQSYEFTMDKLNMKFKTTDYILLRGMRVYVISLSAPPEMYPKFPGEFRKILGSFRFE